MPPLVSIIIPSFNCGRFIADAVRSAFVQTYAATECIVIDDGSTDHTPDVLVALKEQFPRLRVVRQTNGGPSSARNLGLTLCSGSLISFLDADDVLLPDKVERQVDYLRGHPNVGLVYGDYLLAREDLHPVALFSAEMPHDLTTIDALSYRNWFNPVVTILRRSMVDEVGRFDETIAVGEDWDYWIRCATVTQLAYLPGPVALYRQHAAQIHRDHCRMRRSCIQVAMKNFENDKQRRAAIASINITHARYLWRHRRLFSSAAALLQFAISGRFGLHSGAISRRIGATFRSQLRTL